MSGDETCIDGRAITCVVIPCCLFPGREVAFPSLPAGVPSRVSPRPSSRLSVAVERTVCQTGRLVVRCPLRFHPDRRRSARRSATRIPKRALRRRRGAVQFGIVHACALARRNYSLQASTLQASASVGPDPVDRAGYRYSPQTCQTAPGAADHIPCCLVQTESVMVILAESAMPRPKHRDNYEVLRGAPGSLTTCGVASSLIMPLAIAPPSLIRSLPEHVLERMTCLPRSPSGTESFHQLDERSRPFIGSSSTSTSDRAQCLPADALTHFFENAATFLFALVRSDARAPAMLFPRLQPARIRRGKPS